MTARRKPPPTVATHLLDRVCDAEAAYTDARAQMEAVTGARMRAWDVAVRSGVSFARIADAVGLTRGAVSRTLYRWRGKKGGGGDE